jgi:predicted glycoside hydrolase/deacetylase ChbG (UPF0249 family)
MTIERHLIVNADDFGQSHGVNRGVIEAHENGIVTSASLMVRWPAAVEAAAYAREHPRLSLGLHVDLGEWTYRKGAWEPVYTVVPADNIVALEEEIHRQFEAFRSLAGRDPTHIDSHQHVHRDEPVRSILAGIADRLGVPLRGLSAVRYCGNFYGQTATGDPWHQGISVEALLQLLAELAPGITELGCHPGSGNDLETMYLREREQEVTVLCDRRVQQAIASERICLWSFHGINTFDSHIH